MATKKEKVIDLKPKAEKVTKEEFRNLQAVVDQNNNITFRLGQLEIEKHELVHRHADVRRRIIESQKELVEKYGTANVDLETGVINYPKEEEDNDGESRN